jgi:indole-3-glycerol phosphate synthase
MNARNVACCLDVYGETPWISAISVLTEEDNFGGSLEDLVMARSRCGSKPLLRKDFITTEYQVYEARAFGADAVLLMAAIHRDPSRLLALFELARDLRMDALLEIGHGGMSPPAMRGMIPEDAAIWGINSRTFDGRWGARMALSRVVAAVTSHDLRTETSRHAALRSLVPHGKIAVAESGIMTADELRATADNRYNAALIGTAFLKSAPIEDVVTSFARVFEQYVPDGAGRRVPSSAPA